MENIFAHLSLETLHHAYLVPNAHEGTKAALFEFLKKENVTITENPDIYNATFSTFTVEDASILKSQQLLRGIGNGKKFFIIYFTAMTSEAEHALLKVLEEPARDVHFFFLTPQSATMKDTLLSRMQIIVGTFANEEIGNAKMFLEYAIQERLAFVTKFLKAFDDEEDTGKVRNASIKFLQGITSILYETNHDLVHTSPALFRELENCIVYLHDRGSSPKMLLEHIALMLP